MCFVLLGAVTGCGDNSEGSPKPLSAATRKYIRQEDRVRCENLLRLERRFPTKPKTSEEHARELRASVKAGRSTVRAQRRIPGPRAVRSVYLRYLSGIERTFDIWERKARALETHDGARYAAAVAEEKKLRKRQIELQDAHDFVFDSECPYGTRFKGNPASTNS
jgi:hypothetical protein